MKLLLWEEFRKILERINPLSPPSAPLQRRLQGPPAKSNFLAVGKSHFRWWSSAPDDWEVLDDIVERLIQPSGIDDA
jgi:hypothetical protein